MNTPIKLINPLSEHPTEMWLQAIADFEVTISTPGYEINMDLWHAVHLGKVCEVCMAGASMVRRSQALPDEVFLDLFSERDKAKFQSIDDMRRGHFCEAIDWLSLGRRNEGRWMEALEAAEPWSLLEDIRDANQAHDWPRLIKLLREAIARIDAEYVRLDPANESAP